MNNTPRYSELSDEDLRLVHEISEQFERDLGDGRSVEIADLIANAPATIRQFLFSELVEIKLNFPGDNSKLNADELIAQFPEFQAEIDSILEQDSEREKTKLPESLGSGSRLAGQYDLIEQIGEGRNGRSLEGKPDTSSPTFRRHQANQDWDGFAGRRCSFRT